LVPIDGDFLNDINISLSDADNEKLLNTTIAFYMHFHNYINLLSSARNTREFQFFQNQIHVLIDEYVQSIRVIIIKTINYHI
jgi:hypothetical protein